MAEMVVTPTPITQYDRIDFVGKKKFITIDTSMSLPFSYAIVKLWVWDGDLNKPYINNLPPTQVYKKYKVSLSDTSLEIEIGSVIKSFINPQINFNPSTILVSGEGVYYQYEVYRYNDDDELVNNSVYNTRFATLGYNWNYEGDTTFTYNRGSFGTTASNIKKYYSPNINYYDGEINLSGATSSNATVVRVPAVYNNSDIKCSPDQYLIVYLNKYGLWDTLTPNGKVIVNNAITRESYNKTFRRSSDYIPSTSHETIQFNINSKQTYIINTGILLENMGMLFEEILISNKIYLVQFFDQVTVPSITADNTIISVDNTLITVDSYSNYTKFRQIPVVVTDNDFGRKTKLNDKNKISYNIKFEEASFKINNIR